MRTKWSFGESEQEFGDEDISRELNDSDLSKSIQPPVPGLFFQDKIKHARGLMDSASTQEALRDCDLEGRDEVSELEAQTTDICYDLYQQPGTESPAVEVIELERFLTSDVKLVTQGLKQLEQEMNDK